MDSRVHLQDQGEFHPAAVMFFSLSLDSSLLFKNISRVTYHELKVFFDLVLQAFVFQQSDFVAIGKQVELSRMTTYFSFPCFFKEGLWT